MYEWEQRLRGEYTRLPEGFRRLWIATSAVWLIAYSILNWNALALLYDGALATPQTTCAQVYPHDESRQSHCERTAGYESVWSSIERERKGLSRPFDPYFEEYREDWKLFVWLGAPVAWLILIWMFVWVRQGLKAKS